MHTILTRVPSCHFDMVSTSPETSGTRSCDGDVLDDNYEVGVKLNVRVSTRYTPPLNAWYTAKLLVLGAHTEPFRTATEGSMCTVVSLLFVD